MNIVFEKIEGVILRTQDYGETHKLVTIFTKEKGRVTAIARGAKKTKSRMAAITQPFILGTFLMQGGSGLGTLQQGEVILSYRKIREDIIKTAYASYIAELTNKLIDEKIADPFIYKQFVLSLQAITEDKDPEIIAMMYELKLYKKAGFAPILQQCAHCGQKNDTYPAFSVQEGGLICQRCIMVDIEAITISSTIVKLLQMFSVVDIERIGNISVKTENKKLMYALMETYYDQYGGYFIKSKKFLKQLDLFADTE